VLLCFYSLLGLVGAVLGAGVHQLFRRFFPHSGPASHSAVVQVEIGITKPQPRWQGWDVWVIGLCLAIFGALWLLQLSEGPLLNRSLFAGAGVGSNVVLPVALATTILLAGAAFLYMLARNIKTPSARRSDSWKRRLGRTLVPAIAVALLLRTFVIHPFVVPNNSMSPEITKGSRILVWKLTSTYAPGDIVAYRHEDKIWVARVTQVGPAMLTLQKNSKMNSEVPREAVIGKVISVFWRPSPGVNSGVMQPPPQRAENARPAAATESWSPSPAPVTNEQVRQISTDAKALQELGRYDEALQRHLWLHHHGVEIAPSLFGLRMSFWLSDWAELAHRFPKAKQALIEIRDQKSRELGAGRGDFGLFIEVDRINSSIHDDSATLFLSKQIEQADPELANQCAPIVGEAAARLFGQGERVTTPSQWPLEKALADLQAVKAERDLLPSKSFPSEAHKENEALKLERKIQLFEEVAARRRTQLEQSLSKP
jgi:Signal peptidase, peptidase S26